MFANDYEAQRSLRSNLQWNGPVAGNRFNAQAEVTYSLNLNQPGAVDLNFAPATRFAYNVSPAWAVAVEEYADFGPLQGFYGASQQTHQLFAVVDHTTKFLAMEAGAGFGLTSASDGLTLKLILSRDLN